MIMEYIGKLFLYHTGFVSSAFKSAIYTTSIFWRKKKQRVFVCGLQMAADLPFKTRSFKKDSNLT